MKLFNLEKRGDLNETEEGVERCFSSFTMLEFEGLPHKTTCHERQKEVLLHAVPNRNSLPPDVVMISSLGGFQGELDQSVVEDKRPGSGCFPG